MWRDHLTQPVQQLAYLSSKDHTLGLCDSTEVRRDDAALACGSYPCRRCDALVARMQTGAVRGNASDTPSNKDILDSGALRAQGSVWYPRHRGKCVHDGLRYRRECR